MECAFQQFESSCWGDMGSSDVSMLQREQFLVKREPIAVQQLGLHQVWRRVMLALWQCIVTKPSWQWRKRNACSPCHAHRSGGTKDSTWWCSVSAHCVSLMLSILALPASGLGSRYVKKNWPHYKRKTKEIDEDATWQCHGFAFDQLMSFVRSCSQLGGKLDGDDAPVLGPWWFFYMSALNGVIATVEKILWRRPPPDGILQRN